MFVPASTRRKFLCLALVVLVLLLVAASTQHPKVKTYLPSLPNLLRPSKPPELLKEDEEIKDGPVPWGANGWVGGPHKGPGPEYKRFILAEQAFPQHNLDAPFPQGRTGKYVKFSNQIRALGWNNVFNDVLLCAHAAYRAKRSYVFQDYVWKPDYYPWRIPDWPWPRNPLTTLISGPVAGGPWEEGDTTPRSVREDFWPLVCPPEDTEVIDTDIGKKPVFWSDGQTIMDHWVKLLSESPKRCVEVVASLSGEDHFAQTFDLWLIGTSRLLSVWPEFKASPISRLLGTSPLVQSAVDANEELFFPKGSRPVFGWDPYERMMAAHIRRGDYIEACNGLANWNSTFYGWNNLPELPDPFTAPPNEFEGGHAPPEHIEFYMHRCLPTNEEILKKIMDSKTAWENNGKDRHLQVLFIMTNAKQEWVDAFTKSLRDANAGWEVFVTTKDLKLDFEQIGVNMAVDMELARKAAVYIGNGWSSMTSNILHRRLVDGKEPLANRFW